MPNDVLDNYKGFLSVGKMSVVGDSSMGSPITILRDKTHKRILQHVHWFKIWRDVQYCRTCHTCQMVGKPNQTILTAYYLSDGR